MLKHFIASILFAAATLEASVVITTQAADFAGRGVRQGFDGLTAGTDITNREIDGIRYVGPFAPLEVVTASSTLTPSGFAATVNTALNTLPATSGENILSPGGSVLAPGSNPAVEADWLTLEFISAVTFFGFDLLQQSADGASYVFVEVYGHNNTLLYSGRVGGLNLGGGGAPSGSEFWGIMTTENETIARIAFRELDGDARYPDANIGFDSFRYGTESEVPEPNTIALVGTGLALGAMRLKRK